jgi:anti-anti-sigma factor
MTLPELGAMTIVVHEQMQVAISRSGGDPVTYVQVSGDVDITSARTLGRAARQLTDAEAVVTYVDLAGVTVLGAALVGFLVQVGTATSSSGTSNRTLVLCRPSARSRQTIQKTGLHRIADLRPDLPPDWPTATTPCDRSSGRTHRAGLVVKDRGAAIRCRVTRKVLR